jgi:protein-tyrosine-phosphatase
MVQPINQAAILGDGMNLVPNYAAQQAQAQQMALQQSQQQLAQQSFRQKQMEAQRELDQEDAYQADLKLAIQSGNPQDIINLSYKYSKQSEGVKRSFDMQDEVVRNADRKQAVTLLSYVRNGRADLAAQSLQDRIAKSRQAGEPDDPQDLAILEALKSGDPARVKEAEGLITYYVAATSDDPAKTLGDLNPKTNAPNVQKEVEYYRSIGRDDLAEAELAKAGLLTVPGAGVYRVSDFMSGGSLVATPEQQAQSEDFARRFPNAPKTANDGIPATGQAIEQQALSLVPGIVVTSGKRSPEKNAAVNGQPDSFHLTDQARDFVPPKGTSMGKLAMILRKGFPGFDVINEGDHVHVEPKVRGPVKVKSKQQFDKLASGTEFIAPDGSRRVKP